MAKAKDWITEEGLSQITEWMKLGITKEQLSHNMGINKRTLMKWQNEYPEISDAIKEGQKPVYLELENALFKSAKGYEVTEQERTSTFDAQKRLTGTVIKTKTRHIPPNTASCIFLLKNLCPQKWRDNPMPIESYVTVDDGFIKALRGTAKEDWKEEIAESSDVNAE